MRPSTPTSTSSVARRSSAPGPLRAVDARDAPVPAERPPLELKRPPSPDTVARQKWGSPDYRSESRFSHLGPNNLDVVASFLPQAELKNVAAAEPALGSAPLVSGVLQAQTRIDIAGEQQIAASDQLGRAADQLLDLGEQSPCRVARPALVLGGAGIGVGSGFTVLAVGSGGGAAAMVLGCTFLALGTTSLLGGAIHFIRDAYDRRCANHALSAAQNALATALDEEAQVREEVLPPRVELLRSVDLKREPATGGHPVRDEMPAEIDGLLAPSSK